MRHLLAILLLTALSISFAQEKSKIVTDEKTKRNMYVGLGDKSVFKDTSFATWYGAEYDMYEVDRREMSRFKPEMLKDVSITIVLGTWCSDTKREIPRFIKLLEAVKFDETKLKMIFVNREKKNPFEDISSLEAKNIPTIIVYKEGKEKGRIIEAPKETLEKDFLELIK